jgi:hypothetical protein
MINARISNLGKTRALLRWIEEMRSRTAFTSKIRYAPLPCSAFWSAHSRRMVRMHYSLANVAIATSRVAHSRESARGP